MGVCVVVVRVRGGGDCVCGAVCVCGLCGAVVCVCVMGVLWW